MKIVIVNIILIFFSYKVVSQIKDCKKCVDKGPDQINIDIVGNEIENGDNVCTYFRKNTLFHLINVNPYMYNVSIQEIQRDVINKSEISPLTSNFSVEKSFSFVSSTPSTFNLPRTLGTDAGVDRSTMTRIESLQKSINAHNDSIPYYESKLNSVKELIGKFMDESIDVDKFLNYSKIFGYSYDQATDAPLLLGKLGDKILKYEDSIRISHRKNVKIAEDRKELNDLILSSNNTRIKIDYYLKMYSEYISKVQKIYRINYFYNDFLQLLHSVSGFDEINRRLVRLKSNYNLESANSSSYTKLIIDDFEKLDLIYLNIVESRKSIVAETDASFDELRKFHSNLNRDLILKTCQEVAKLENSLIKSNWDIYYRSNSIDRRADEVIYIFDLSPKKSSFSDIEKPIRYEFSRSIYGGIKIDVSAGLLFHYGLNDYIYSLKAITDTTTLAIREFGNRVIPSAGALLNIYRRSPNPKMALNIGTGTNTDRIFYYFGTSFLLGSDERIGLGLGVVGGNTRRPSKFYQINKKDEQFVINSPIDQINPGLTMVDRFGLGAYFTVTYNLSGSNKDVFNIKPK